MPNQTQKIQEQINSQLNRVNGKSRARTINFEDVIQVLREVTDRGFGWINGGTVANAYGYPAKASACLGWKRGKTIVLRFGTKNATKAASKVTWAGITANTAKHKTAFIANEEPKPETDVVVPARIARFLIVARAAQALVDFPEWEQKGFSVTRSDSLAAGNCVAITCDLILKLGRPEALPANELMRRTSEIAPHLLKYAWRAVGVAENRMEVK